MKTGIELIAQERRRQQKPKSRGGEGWTPTHDDTHTKGEMAGAAACYAIQTFRGKGVKWEQHPAPGMWPWHWSWWKPKNNNIRNLVKSGALIAAEIDRLQRAKDE